MARSDALNTAFSEVNDNPPKVVQSTARKFGADRARKQKIAIALSKARKSGAKIPGPKLRSGSRSI
jgi:hypothetical protein